MAEALGVGIIGTGDIAQSHLKALADIDEARVAVTMDIDEARARAAAEQFGGRATTDLAEVLRADEVQAVHVCTPHHLHADQVVAALEAGKHVLVEKPMALALADCDRMIAAAESAGRVLMVGQVLRHFPANRKVRELIAGGAIGAVGHLIRRRHSYFDVSGETRNWYMDKEAGGNAVLMAFGTHEYDILPWYLQSPVVKVYSQGAQTSPLYEGQSDFFGSVLNHANGAVSVVTQSVVCRGGAGDQVIVGSKGTLQVNNREVKLNGEEVAVEGDTGLGMPNQVREFVTCCLQGGTPDANGRSVRHSMAILTAVALSAERGEPVEIGELDPA